MKSPRLRIRLLGLPRSLNEVSRSLQLLGSYRDLGWHASLRRGLPIDNRGRPLAWYTYPCLDWLEPRLAAADRVFEFGAGWSTLWYGERVDTVVAVENDEAWISRLSDVVQGNVKLHHRPSAKDEVGDPRTATSYALSITDHPQDFFDVVAVDGMERLACVHWAVPHLKTGGLLILDNSDRPTFQPAIQFLQENGFGRIDFYGFPPTLGVPACTSIFSRAFDRWLDATPPVRSWGV